MHPARTQCAISTRSKSSGRYAVHGDVTDWIPVGNHLIYDDNPDSNAWLFLQDTIHGWYNQQIAAGKTPAQINAYFSTDGAEAEAGWTYKPTTGFHVTNGTESKLYNHLHSGCM